MKSIILTIVFLTVQTANAFDFKNPLTLFQIQELVQSTCTLVVDGKAIPFDQAVAVQEKSIYLQATLPNQPHLTARLEFRYNWQPTKYPYFFYSQVDQIVFLLLNSNTHNATWAGTSWSKEVSKFETLAADGGTATRWNGENAPYAEAKLNCDMTQW